MAFQQEPSFQHGQVARTAVLYCNLGTPSAPTAPALRKYLAEFLGDSRVVEIPKPIWWLILHGIILRVRPAKSAAKYASIWTEQGSPLKAFTELQAQSLDAAMQQRFESARARGKVLRYVGRLSAEGTATVGVVELDARHPFANIALTDNVVRFATSRYNNNPMIVQGPGAGPEVTAGGIFADLLRLSAYLGARL